MVALSSAAALGLPTDREPELLGAGTEQALGFGDGEGAVGAFSAEVRAAEGGGGRQRHGVGRALLEVERGVMRGAGRGAGARVWRGGGARRRTQGLQAQAPGGCLFVRSGCDVRLGPDGKETARAAPACGAHSSCTCALCSM